MNQDTIYAISTGSGKSAVAVIRVSGPRVDSILMRLCGRSDFIARRATLTPIFDENGDLLDRSIVIKFENPRSFTGEPMVEFQVTGGRAVTQGLLHALSVCEATRPAEAGEFAKRAFENHKIDLVEVEALADVVEAETRVQLRHAQTLASGELSHICDEARGDLLRSMAVLESILDFSDIEDAQELSIGGIVPIVAATVSKLEQLLKNTGVSERLRDGMSVVIAGPPNVGKSTLLNCLAQRDIAIVSPTAGTTRDTIEAFLDIEGFPVVLTDTAGIRPTRDPIEEEGIARARKKAAFADLVLWLSDVESVTPADESFTCPIFKVRTKSDLCEIGLSDTSTIPVSARTGQGVDLLLSRIADFARHHFSGAGSIVAATDRQRVAIRDVIKALNSIVSEPLRAPELIAEDLRSGVYSLSRVTGRVDIEEVLGEIFSRLCVGK